MIELPNIDAATWELLISAKDENEQRFFLSISNLCCLEIEGKRKPAFDYRYGWLFNQFRDFLMDVNVSVDDFEKPEQKESLRKFHLLAYSLFWECTDIQRLLLSLVRTASGLEYDPDLIIAPDKRRRANSVYEEIRSKSKSLGLAFGDIINSLYSNQLRNAIAHSELWISSDYLVLQNHDPKRNGSIGSIPIVEWDSIYTQTLDLVAAIIRHRGIFRALLRSKCPYPITLAELESTFNIIPDPRGGWNFESNPRK